jgi:hypothetical protein
MQYRRSELVNFIINLVLKIYSLVRFSLQFTNIPFYAIGSRNYIVIVHLHYIYIIYVVREIHSSLIAIIIYTQEI